MKRYRERLTPAGYGRIAAPQIYGQVSRVSHAQRGKNMFLGVDIQCLARQRFDD